MTNYDDDRSHPLIPPQYVTLSMYLYQWEKKNNSDRWFEEIKC